MEMSLLLEHHKSNLCLHPQVKSRIVILLMLICAHMSLPLEGTLAHLMSPHVGTSPATDIDADARFDRLRTTYSANTTRGTIVILFLLICAHMSLPLESTLSHLMSSHVGASSATDIDVDARCDRLRTTYSANTTRGTIHAGVW